MNAQDKCHQFHNFSHFSLDNLSDIYESYAASTIAPNCNVNLLSPENHIAQVLVTGTSSYETLFAKANRVHARKTFVNTPRKIFTLLFFKEYGQLFSKSKAKASIFMFIKMMEATQSVRMLFEGKYVLHSKL